MEITPFPNSLVEGDLRPLVPQAVRDIILRQKIRLLSFQAPPADVNMTLDLEVVR